MKYLLISLPMLVIAALTLFPINLPYAVEASGKIMPHREWMIMRKTDGSLMALTTDHLKGIVKDYTILQTDNGDQVSFQLYPSIKPGATVVTGDTIAYTHSAETQRRLTQIQGDLTTERASLSLYQTGEKPSVIQEARQRLSYAETKAENQKKHVVRLRELYKKNAISEQELEIAENDLRLGEIQIAIEKEQLKTVNTGAIDQRISWVQARIEALQNEMAILEKRLEMSAITAPFSGFISGYHANDTLAVICDTNKYAVVLPVHWQNRAYIASAQSVSINAVGLIAPLVGTVEDISNRVWIFNGEPYCRVTVSVVSHNKPLPPGLLVRCAISCSPVHPVEYLKRVFQG